MRLGIVRFQNDRSRVAGCRLVPISQGLKADSEIVVCIHKLRIVGTARRNEATAS